MSILTLVITFLGSLLKSQRQLRLENLALRQQVTMLRQSVGRPRATVADKLLCSKRYVNKRKHHPRQTRRQSTSPNATHHITTVEHVRFVGYNRDFYPGGRPLFTPNSANYLPVKFLKISYRHGFDFPHHLRQVSELLQGGSAGDTFR